MEINKELQILIEIEDSLNFQINAIENLNIKSLEDLERYVLDNDLNEVELSNLIFKAISTYPNTPINCKETLIQSVRDFLFKHPLNSPKERPFFI